MTLCITGDHEFPYEDKSGAYCAEHGVTLLWHPPEFAWDDVLTEPGHPRGTPASVPPDVQQDP